jgi:toxin ParE1/3/4
MAEFRLSPRAQRDLESIFDYTVTQWGLPQAIRYTEALEAACAASAQAPLQSQDCATIRQGYRRRNVEQHVLYFRQTAYGIAVIRILHQRMDQVRHL